MFNNHPGDRKQLEEGEARVLYTTWLITKERVLTPERIAFIEKKYGRGSTERIKKYMALMKDGELI